MILSAAASIEIHKQQINELNVFPVPDGDTGTNMSMTLNAAAADLRKAGSVTLTKAADITASAMLRGARGNSGVILSLLFRGFSKALKGVEACTGEQLAQALRGGVEAAYKAVMKPTEGTILTVARVSADTAIQYASCRAFIITSRSSSAIFPPAKRPLTSSTSACACFAPFAPYFSAAERRNSSSSFRK